METKELFKLLTLINGVTSTKWDQVMELVRSIETGQTTVQKQNGQKNINKMIQNTIH